MTIYEELDGNFNFNNVGYSDLTEGQARYYYENYIKE